MYRHIIGLVVALVVTIGFYSQPAEAHNLGVDSVNRHEFVVVNDQTRYNSVLYDSMAWWNRFYFQSDRRGAAFDYARNRPNMGATLRVVDVGGKCGANWAARYMWRSHSIDILQINVCYFNRYSAFTRRVAVGHELGHAFGFDHNGNRRYSIMYPSLSQPTQYPRRHDREDYYRKFV